MTTDQFWAIITSLQGVVTEASVSRLSAALRALKPADLVAYQTHLDRHLASLEGVELRHSDDTVAVGTARRALEMVVIARGREHLEHVVAGGAPVPDPSDGEHALDLESLAREIYEEGGRLWPDVETWRRLGEISVVSASIVYEPAPQTTFVTAVRALLERWSSSAAYADAVLDQGLYAFCCYGAFVYPGDPWGWKPGTRWSSRKGGGGLEVDFTADLTEFDDTAEAAETFLRTMVDDLAAKCGLPTASVVLGMSGDVT